ncbi:Isotrichodermin C-15 hydroxylase [Colletotrichum tanaceti]|nr:Isotrichodermin C-15 hydroxylase [Colletotrichum tanaceti]
MVRYEADAVSFMNNETWKTIHGHGHGQFPKFFASEQLEPQSNIITADDANHARSRRGVALAFSPRSLAEQEPLIHEPLTHEYVDKLVRRLGDVADSRPPTEIGRWFHITSFDIIGDLTFGHSLGGLDSNEVHHVVNRVLLFIERATKIFELNKLLGPLAGLVMPVLARDLKKGFLDQANYTRSAVDRRLAIDADVDRKDFMTGMLRGRDEKNIGSIEEIVANANTLCVAGSDTTATLMTACTFFLLSTPRTYEQAIKEVRDVFDSAAEINFANATARLPYLLAALNATLRLYPPVAGSLARFVPHTEEPVYIDGKHIPPGVFFQLCEKADTDDDGPLIQTRISVHMSSAGLSASNFAKPESFIPERWLPSVAQDPSSPFPGDRRDAIQPFPYGPRNCIGKHLAYSEMRVIMARLLLEFDLKLHPSFYKWT